MENQKNSIFKNVTKWKIFLENLTNLLDNHTEKQYNKDNKPTKQTEEKTMKRKIRKTAENLVIFAVTAFLILTMLSFAEILGKNTQENPQYSEGNILVLGVEQLNK